MTPLQVTVAAMLLLGVGFGAGWACFVIIFARRLSHDIHKQATYADGMTDCTGTQCPTCGQSWPVSTPDNPLPHRWPTIEKPPQPRW